MKTMLFNPYSGLPRHPSDIASDPAGALLVDPDEPLRAAPKATQAAIDVLAERQRQISEEGWTPEHDDEHGGGQMAGAAACYASHVNARGWVLDGLEDGLNVYQTEPTPDAWPWDEPWWKPTDPRRDLVKAGALILAEIERIDRMGNQGAQE